MEPPVTFPAPEPLPQGRREETPVRRGRLASAAGGVLVTLTAVGCGASSTPASLPSKAPSPTPSPTPTKTAQQQVIAAFDEFWQAGAAAQRSAPTAARTMLAPLVAEPYLDHLLTQMNPYRARHQQAWGYVIPHVTQIDVNADRALLHDCQDESHAALADSNTGQVIPGTYGSSHVSYVATLGRGADGHWRMTAMEALETTCEPGS